MEQRTEEEGSRKQVWERYKKREGEGSEFWRTLEEIQRVVAEICHETLMRTEACSEEAESQEEANRECEKIVGRNHRNSWRQLRLSGFAGDLRWFARNGRWKLWRLGEEWRTRPPQEEEEKELREWEMEKEGRAKLADAEAKRRAEQGSLLRKGRQEEEQKRRKAGLAGQGEEQQAEGKQYKAEIVEEEQQALPRQIGLAERREEEQTEWRQLARLKGDEGIENPTVRGEEDVRKRLEESGLYFQFLPWGARRCRGGKIERGRESTDWLAGCVSWRKAARKRCHLFFGRREWARLEMGEWQLVVEGSHDERCSSECEVQMENFEVGQADAGTGGEKEQ